MVLMKYCFMGKGTIFSKSNSTMLRTKIVYHGIGRQKFDTPSIVLSVACSSFREGNMCHAGDFSQEQNMCM